MNILMIGAHPDDCDFRCSGLAYLYARDGHRVRFLSMCDGSGGHHEMSCEETAARRRGEAREAGRAIGIEYDVWDIPDCELVCDLETRKRLIRYIRAFRPDAIFCHRTNDYHADHRAAGLLVQDASYLLIVPHFCADAPALREMPVILFFDDAFQNPPFRADVVIGIDDVVENKFRMLDRHVSQVYEWLPYTHGTLEQVPKDPAARYAWLHGDPVTKDTSDEEVLRLTGYSRRFALPAAKYREALIRRYGPERGGKIRFAEAYSVSEYGSPLTEEKARVLFPY